MLQKNIGGHILFKFVKRFNVWIIDCIYSLLYFFVDVSVIFTRNHKKYIIYKMQHFKPKINNSISCHLYLVFIFECLLFSYSSEKNEINWPNFQSLIIWSANHNLFLLIHLETSDCIGVPHHCNLLEKKFKLYYSI